MSLLQEKLNTELPYGRVFQGTGEQDPADKDVRFYQHGLYFKADGALAENSPHNKRKLELIASLDGLNPEAPPVKIQQEDRAPINPEIVAKLTPESDERVFEYAVKLSEALAARGEPDEYEPTLEAREDNTRFIAKHASS